MERLSRLFRPQGRHGHQVGNGPLEANLFRLRYRWYYYTYARPLIEQPRADKRFTPRTPTLPYQALIDAAAKVHCSFIYVTFPSHFAQWRINPWTFRLLKFNFQLGDGTPLILPSLTPWSQRVTTEGLEVRYGLNRTFVAKYHDRLRELRFNVFL